MCSPLRPTPFLRWPRSGPRRPLLATWPWPCASPLLCREQTKTDALTPLLDSESDADHRRARMRLPSESQPPKRTNYCVLLRRIRPRVSGLASPHIEAKVPSRHATHTSSISTGTLTNAANDTTHGSGPLDGHRRTGEVLQQCGSPVDV